MGAEHRLRITSLSEQDFLIATNDEIDLEAQAWNASDEPRRQTLLRALLRVEQAKMAGSYDSERAAINDKIKTAMLPMSPEILEVMERNRLIAPALATNLAGRVPASGVTG
ncbi:hypothetical protein [Asticcacaulis sp. EMRT-3]|uniref:hypothetical protein n=1 Tax=Asticcacaulis sp. EMRT-3 TaxID=3040349 RepID=UPI0024AF9AC6|nr:hypothetical protein [Asticcacaulis sp. EMRT-3]MDI7775508.1 hypothetical protein [Asticcacaulis sp. EMRT-3]